jgi:hypothetical protein
MRFVFRRNDMFRVRSTFVVERSLPSFQELCRQFDRVNPAFESLRFKPTAIIGSVIWVPGARGFEIVRVMGPTDDSETFRPLRPSGLYPGTYEEGISFAREFPDVQLDGSILLLGSCAALKGIPHYAVLGCNVGRRVLEILPYKEVSPLDGTYRCLMVRPFVFSGRKEFDADEIIC